jgi:hypothetical protein
MVVEVIMKHILFAIIAVSTTPCYSETATEQVARVATESATTRADSQALKFEQAVLMRYPEIADPKSRISALYKAKKDAWIKSGMKEFPEPSYVMALANEAAKELSDSGVPVIANFGFGSMLMKPGASPSLLGQTRNQPEIDQGEALQRSEWASSNSRVLTRLDSDARGALIVDNGTSSNAIVKIINTATDKKTCSFLVTRSQSFKIPNIPDGTYRLIFCFGGLDIVGKDKFAKSSGSSEFKDNLVYTTTTTRTETSIRTSVPSIRVTLHEVVSGNAETDKISVAEFDKY